MVLAEVAACRAGTVGIQDAAEGTQSHETTHRFSYSVEDTSCPKVEGFMARSSRSLYMLCLKRNSSNLWAGMGACGHCNSNCTLKHNVGATDVWAGLYSQAAA